MASVYPRFAFLVQKEAGSQWSETYTDEQKCFDCASQIEDEKRLIEEEKKKSKKGKRK